jgi:hypothetical protein
MTTERRTLDRSIRDAIDKGTTTVEEIHKSIADLPLRILEGSELLKGPAKEVRRAQDRTIGAIYDLIRSINHRVGRFASRLLAAPERRAGHAEHHAAAH